MDIPQAVTVISNAVEDHPANLVLEHANHEDVDTRDGFSDKETMDIMEVIAATGKFWHDWGSLKSLLSSRLKQVLAEYPEFQAAASVEFHHTTLPEEIVRILDEELQKFTDGPPFTLQRLCEILLNPRSIYPRLSRLVFALEKNLLVTSTLSICTDPYPRPIGQPVGESANESEPIENQSSPIQNGVTNGEVDADEEMIEADANDNVSDMEMQDIKIGETGERSSEQSTDSSTPAEQSTAAE